jgi:hypothetical protein
MLVVLALDPRHVGLRFVLFLTARVVDAFDTDPHWLAVQPASHDNDVDFARLSGDGIWELDRLPNLFTVFHQLDTTMAMSRWNGWFRLGTSSA